MTVFFEKYEKDSNGDFVRHVELQTELAEWERDGAGYWRRKLKEWAPEP